MENESILSASTAKPEVPGVPKSKPKGGRGARDKRRDARRAKSNNDKVNNFQKSVDDKLGLTETSTLAKLTPACSSRPGGVHINLIGYNASVNAMTRRFRVIAARPLSNVLNNESIRDYRKVCEYVATVRVACAQKQLKNIVGNATDLEEAFTVEEIDTAEVE